MSISTAALRYLRAVASTPSLPAHSATVRAAVPRGAFAQHCQRRGVHVSQRRSNQSLSDLVNNPPQLVSTRRKHGPGLIVLGVQYPVLGVQWQLQSSQSNQLPAIIPLTAFALGTWQVQRLGWKTDLIARFEDRLIRDPLPLPPYIDPGAVTDFDYRRVYATGILRHDQEMLIGPRTHDGADGYLVITPLDRGEKGTKILVNRGWIAREKASQRTRQAGLPRQEVTVAGLLREPWKKNLFTPDNKPEKGEWYFPDVAKMAEFTGSQPVWIEETMQPDLIVSMNREAAGVPIGRAAEVNLRNNHTQYIFTWYALGLATSVMFYMVVKKPAGSSISKVRRNVEW